MNADIICHGLVEHLVRCNHEQILTRSLMHCHGKNLHSIMLLECPGKTIRLFVAEPGHELEHNHPLVIMEKQSLGFHAHHCDLTLSCTRGQLHNWIIEKNDDGSMGIDSYLYNSQITNGKIGFVKKEKDKMSTKSILQVNIGEPHFMKAEEIHSVIVPEGQWAAWFALEGEENPHHDNYCWSYSPLDTQDFSDLYKPMSASKLSYLLSNAFEL